MSDLLDDHVETEFIQTPPIHRPQPDVSPPGVEYRSISEIPKEMDRWVGFSGGTDSLAVTHYAMSHGLAQGVVYCDTGSGLAENLDYVRQVCDRHKWPLVVVPPRHFYELPAIRYGFPGPDRHSHWFNYCKGDGWRELWRQIDGSLKLITGVRQSESDVRIKTVKAEVQYEDDNFKGWYINPFWKYEGQEVHEYIEEHGLRVNPCYSHINRSGDCYCMAYAGRDELVELATHYPEHYHWMMNAERRVQEYRGRLKLVEDIFPGTVEYARQEVRTRGAPPYPIMHEVLRDNFPAHYSWALEQSRRAAILRGMQEHTCYIGHGGESTERLKRAAEQADQDQTSICDISCNAKAVMGINPTVEKSVQAAEEALKTEQVTFEAVQ